MGKAIKVSSASLFIPAFIALILTSCEMEEETILKPEVIITSPENNTNIIQGTTIKISAQLKHFNQRYKVHRITLTAGDSTIIKKEGHKSRFSHCFSTESLPGGNTQQLSARVWFTDENPDDKDWNYFSVRDHYDNYIKQDNNRDGNDTLQIETSINVNLEEHPGNTHSMEFVSFSADTMTVDKDTIMIDSMDVAKYEVTNLQYTKFMNAVGVDSTGSYKGIKYIYLNGTTGITHNGEHFTTRNGWESLPVVNVTWRGANSFCQWMGGRLPTEKEWYYASKPHYPYGGTNYSLDEIAWYKGNSNSQLHTVGLKAPNAYDIYDMSGNAAEWCFNWYNESSKAYRGGHWGSPASEVSTSKRFNLAPEKAGSYLGFRVAIPHGQ